MGEYYDWVNIDKKEYICPADFDLGNKLHETMFAENHLLGALYNLLSSDWKGDAVLFLGDQSDITVEESNPVLKRLFLERQAWNEPGGISDYVTETYKCISGLFKEAEKEVRNEIEGMKKYNCFDFNCYQVDLANPYEGLFVRNSCFFRYTINHSKRVYFDIESLKQACNDANYNSVLNPLPLLLAFGGATETISGSWIADKIEVSDEAPPKDYVDMSTEYIYEIK